MWRVDIAEARNTFDKQPPERSRDIVERELERQDAKLQGRKPRRKIRVKADRKMKVKNSCFDTNP
jgi:hypothetical protein